MKTPNRFSLVEFLILLVVFGTLGSFALPLLQKVKEAADLAKCRSNLYELGAASHLYASENGGRLPEVNPFGIPVRLEGTYIGDGRIYSSLITPEFGGFGQRDYLGRVHPLMCPSLAPDVYENSGYKRPEEISEANRIERMGYLFAYHPYGFGEPSFRANDTIHGNPHNPLCFDFGPNLVGHLGGLSGENPSHPEVMNVLHLGGHVTTFPLEEAHIYTSWTALYDALRENSSPDQP